MGKTVARSLATSGKASAAVRHPGAATGRKLLLMVSLVSMAALASSAGANDNGAGAEAKLQDRSGNPVGKLTINPHENGTVAVQVRVHDLPPGFHGFHVHAVGDCTPPFTSAGGHFDKDKHTHGSHSGDLPVLQVNENGTGKATIHTDRFSIADLFDSDGSAIIIHANPDNYANIPTRYAAAPDAATLATGDAGDRIACGVIERTAKQ